MSFAGKNLRYLRKLRGWTQEEFSRKLKIKRSLIGAYEEERAEPRLDILQTVSHIFKISLDELFFTDLAASKGGTYVDKRRNMKLSSTATAQIHFVPVKATAGYLTGYADPEFIDELNTFTLPMLAPGNYRAFEISGDSMLPTPSGSIIVSEKIENLNDIANNHLYIVISKNDGIVYKRLQRNNRAKNKLTLISDNPLYPPYQINEEDIVEIWKAQMIITKAAAQPRWDVNQLSNVVHTLQEQVQSLKKQWR